MIHTFESNCLWCKHYLGDRRCEAFPEKIPDILWAGKNLHREPFEGDNGIIFERKEFELPFIGK